jgi:hypothetical protein
MRLLRLAFIAAVAACFDPALVDGALVCGPPPDVCPPDFACGGDGHCWRAAPDAGEQPPDAGEQIPDAADPVPDAKVPACRDGIDNDCDGRTDWPDDPGCSSPDDDDEHGTAECDDGIDNDHDGKTDYHIGARCGPGDDKCHSPLGDHER